MFAYKNMNSASNISAYYLLFQKRTKVLNILKKGLQVAGITSSDLEGISTDIGDGIGDGEGSSKSNCSIMWKKPMMHFITSQMHPIVQ